MKSVYSRSGQVNPGRDGRPQVHPEFYRELSVAGRSGQNMCSAHSHAGRNPVSTAGDSLAIPLLYCEDPHWHGWKTSGHCKIVLAGKWKLALCSLRGLFSILRAGVIPTAQPG